MAQTNPQTSWKDIKNFATDLPGGSQSVNDAKNGNIYATSRGVFSEFPASTPKYHTSNRTDALGTMARLMIPLANDSVRDKFLKSFRGDPDALVIAQSLAVTDKSIGGTGFGVFGMGYIDFLLQNANEAYEEKAQVVDVLSDNYVAYYFGQHPPVFNYSGTLLNTYQDDWRRAFHVLYQSIGRGTQLARRRITITLAYDNMAVTGTMMGMSQILTAELQMAASFNFRMLVKRVDTYRLPNTEPNPPGPFSQNVVNPSTFGNIQLERVNRTFRVIQDPSYVTQEPAGTAQSEEAAGPGLTEEVKTKAENDPSLKQATNDVRAAWQARGRKSKGFFGI